MKELIVLLLFISSHVTASEVEGLLSFQLSKVATFENQKSQTNRAKTTISYNLNEEVVYDKNKTFKVSFVIKEIDGSPQLSIKLYDYDSNDSELFIGNATLNTEWNNSSDLTWSFNGIKYSLSMTPKKSNV